MPDQRRHAPATSEVPVPLHTVAIESGTDSATEYDLSTRRQQIDTASKQCDVAREAPDPPPPPV